MFSGLQLGRRRDFSLSSGDASSGILIVGIIIPGVMLVGIRFPPAKPREKH